MAKYEAFRCLKCLHCCFFASEEEAPVVFSWEARRLRELLEERGASSYEFKPLEVYVNKDGVCVVLLYRWVIRGFCPFYDVKSRRCTIHPEKPSSCRIYPLLVAVPGGEVRISGACEWVDRNRWIIERGELLEKVMPAEVEAARRIVADYVAAVQLLRDEGFAKTEDLSRCRVVRDFEDIVAEGGELGEEEEAG